VSGVRLYFVKKARVFDMERQFMRNSCCWRGRVKVLGYKKVET